MDRTFSSLKPCLLLVAVCVTQELDAYPHVAAQQPEGPPVIRIENPFKESVTIAMKCLTHNSWVDGQKDGKYASWIDVPGRSTGKEAILKTMPHDGDYRFVVKNLDGSQRHTEILTIDRNKKITLKWAWLYGGGECPKKWEYYFEIEDED